MRVSATPYPMDRADAALRDLRHDRVNGAAVLVVLNRDTRSAGRAQGLAPRTKTGAHRRNERSADGAPVD